MGARRKARELALQMLFQQDVAGTPPPDIFEHFEELHKAREDVRGFARRLVEGTVEKKKEIDVIITEQADHWRLTRMAIVDLNIIRMAVYEFFFDTETPKLVVINEAIEIAKKFSTEKSSQFINGVLDGILKKHLLVEPPR